MAAGSGPTNTDTVYSSRTLSKWFAIASILLLIVTIWAAIQDYARPWKKYQRQHQAMATAINERKLLEANKALNKTQLEKIEADIASLEAKQKEVTREIDAKIEKLAAELYIITAEYQTQKGLLDAEHYRLEGAIARGDSKVPSMLETYNKNKKKVRRLFLKQEEAALAKEAAEKTKKDILSQQKELNDQLAALTRTREQLTKAINSTKVSLLNLARNAPILDFIAPTIKVNQIILNGLYDDYFFNKVPRVDRCMTCHVNANKAGFEDFPQPFATHSKLHLIAGPDSPHPVEKVGCTTCHAGVPQSIDFKKAAHTPKDPVQAAEWKEKYGFYYDSHIKTHMVPLQYTEGKCIQCHAKEVVLDQAPTFNAGMRLIEKYGCFECHKFAGHFEKLAKEKETGPSLIRIASKVDENWIKKWLWDPKSYRPSTTMPAFWKLHNNSDEASLARGKVEVEAITHLLVSKSQPYEPLKLASASKGDIARGKTLVAEVGCLGCHAIDDVAVTRPTDSKELGYRDPRLPMFGPELNQMGSKVTDEWLRSWLKEPKHYWAGTSMPSMKLSDQEAADISAYLLSKRNEAFDALPVPVADDKVRDAVTLEFLEGDLSTRDARTKLASMSLEEKKTYLGEKLVSHYGCYACHAIQGFENAPMIGAELTEEGSKEVTKFAFENVHLPHTSREAWIYTKIRTPRIWDVGKKRDFQNKTRMPHFGFTHEQATAITAIVIGYESQKVDEAKKAPVDSRKEQIIAGHRLVHQKNCIGCHALESKDKHLGGEILAIYADKTEGPPLLYTQGRKTQPEWLFQYLKNTDVMIRPWVKIRMPNFGFSDEQASLLTKYFAAYDNAKYPFTSKHASTLSSSNLKEAENLFNELGCLTCHAVLKPGQDPSGAAPHLKNVKARLNGEWVREWLEDPNAIMPGTRMPSHWFNTDPMDPKSPRMGVGSYFGGDANKQMDAIRDYLFQYGGAAERPPAPKETSF